MAPCCGLPLDTARKQVVIILIILCVCVVIAMGLLCANAREEFREIGKFYTGYEGRRLMIKEGKLVYRSPLQNVTQYEMVRRIDISVQAKSP